MYNTESGEFTKKPFMPSLHGADREIKEWVSANDLRWLVDGDGHRWTLSIEGLPLPSTESGDQGSWRCLVGLSTTLSAEQLVLGGGFHRESDERLLGLVGDKSVTIRLKSKTLEAGTVVGIRRQIIEHVAWLKERLLGPNVRVSKRRLVERWLDQHMVFSDRS